MIHSQIPRNCRLNLGLCFLINSFVNFSIKIRITFFNFLKQIYAVFDISTNVARSNKQQRNQVIDDDL